MAFKAKVVHVEKTYNQVSIQIEFTDGIVSFFDKYDFPHSNELNTSFNEVIQIDLKRMNKLGTSFSEAIQIDLNKMNEFDSEYSKLKTKEGQEISLIEV